jgi:ATP-dependent Clp protease protease subunit
MPIDSSVAELITAQLLVLSQEAPQPIYLYINSTGIAKSNTKYGNEHEAVAVYSMLRAVQKFCPVYTLAMGNAFGEAALLLAAGSPGKRAALRSSTIMLRQPLQRLSGMQASDIDIYRRVTREKTATMAKYLAASTGKSEEDILRDFARPRYFTPYEAVEYGLIDQVGCGAAREGACHTNHGAHSRDAPPFPPPSRPFLTPQKPTTRPSPTPKTHKPTKQTTGARAERRARRREKGLGRHRRQRDAHVARRRAADADQRHVGRHERLLAQRRFR